jgi:hypothetical protein
VALAALLAAGCGPQFGNVHGTVYYKDKPLKGGYVTFSSTEGKNSPSVEIKEDGTYEIAKVPAGAVKICVDTNALKPPAGKGPGGGKPVAYKPPSDKAADKGKGPPTAYKPPVIEDRSKRYVQIPDKYIAPQTTDITYTVTSGSQEFDIKLK